MTPHIARTDTYVRGLTENIASCLVRHSKQINLQNIACELGDVICFDDCRRTRTSLRTLHDAVVIGAVCHRFQGSQQVIIKRAHASVLPEVLSRNDAVRFDIFPSKAAIGIKCGK